MIKSKAIDFLTADGNSASRLIFKQSKMKIHDIFTPNDTPTVTYVDREDLKLEERLANYIRLPKMVVSISGPSKTGKTVLVKRVIDSENIIPVVGAGLTTPEDLWTRALACMDVPSSVTKSVSGGAEISGSMKGSGELSLPLVAKGGAEAQFGGKGHISQTTSETFAGPDLLRVIKEIGGSEFVIFIDDFHYIPVSIRDEIGRQIKVATDNGIKILTASVPHRADDVVRSNPELRGRVAAIDVGTWNQKHLELIAEKGFNALNIDIDEHTSKRLADEALGSPQLMQTICYCLCNVLGIKEKFDISKSFSCTEESISEALLQTSQFTDFSKMLSALHAGPRTRGTERKIHTLIDGTSGDVYRAVLLAIKQEPISLSFTYDSIISRVKKSCVGDSPVGSSISSCLEQMETISREIQPGSPIISWDDDTLDIIDPYFSFYLRCSTKLEKLGIRRAGV